MAVAPQIVQYAESTFSDDGTIDETSASISWLAGDRIYAFGCSSADDVNPALAVPTATGLSFSQLAQVNNTTASITDSVVVLWLATAGSSGSGAVSCVTNTATAAIKNGIAVFVVRGASGQGTPATIDGSTAKTISLNRVGKNSIVLGALVDFAEVGDVVVDATPTGTVRRSVAEAGEADFFVLSWGDQGETGNSSYGITNHTGVVDMSGIVVEVFSVLGDQTGSQFSPSIQAEWKPQRWDFPLDVEFLFDDFLPTAAPSGFTATANFTFGALTVSSAATVVVSGQASFTLGALTTSGAVAVDVAAAASFTLGALTVSSAAAVLVTAQASFTFGALTVTSSASAGGGADLAANITFGALTVSAAATVTIDATATITFGGITVASAATVDIEATASFAFGGITVSAVADNGVISTPASGMNLALVRRRTR